MCCFRWFGTVWEEKYEKGKRWIDTLRLLDFPCKERKIINSGADAGGSKDNLVKDKLPHGGIKVESCVRKHERLSWRSTSRKMGSCGFSSDKATGKHA